MELKAYEEIIDFPLFYQMKNLIIRMAEKPEKRDKSLFGYQKPDQTMEEQYGLKYPGEVLERYEERCGGDISKLRALALAVAEEKDLLVPFMFTGSQLTDFENKLRSCAETDLYLAGALYLITDSKGEQNELRDKLIKYECQETPDALFIISILPESDWEYKSGLAACFLGKKRTIKAYGNTRLYAWFLDNYHDEIQKSRRKCIQILKSLLHLSCKYIKEQSPAYLRLTENGYSRQELFYMNFLIPMETNLTDSLDKSSITMERMALDSCRELLNAEKIESEKLYELCQYQLENYKIYNVRLEEKQGIIQSLENIICLKNAETFRFLYQLNENFQLPLSWFYVDIGSENTWDILAEWFSLKEFCKIYEKSLCAMEEPDIEAWLDKYHKLTGDDYTERFWTFNEYNTGEVFRLMVQRKKYDLAELLRQYHADEMKYTKEQLEKKWNYMKNNMISAARYLYSHDVFCFWLEFDKIYGIRLLERFLQSQNSVLSSVKIYGNITNFSFSFPFLSSEEQKVVFNWVEQMVYITMPQNYSDFLYHFLMCDSAQDLFPLESQELFKVVRESKDITDTPYKMNALCKKYYSPEEWEAFQKKEKQKMEMKAQQDMQKRIDKMNVCLQEIVDSSADTCEMYGKLSEIITNYFHYGEEQTSACIAFLENQINEKGGCMSKECMSNILDSLVFSVRWENMEWDTVKRIIMKIEVIENESEKN